jgi:hypothetical protein
LKVFAAIITTPLLLLADLNAAEDEITSYSLTESDLVAIIEQAKNLGVNSSLPILHLTAKWSSHETIQATFQIQVGENTERTKEVEMLDCRQHVYGEWSCLRRPSTFWQVSGFKDDHLFVLADSDFNLSKQTYFDVLDYVVDTEGMAEHKGFLISSVSRDEESFWITYRAEPDQGCWRKLEVTQSPGIDKGGWYIDGLFSRVICR